MKNDELHKYFIKCFSFGVVHKRHPHEGGGSDRCGQMQTRGGRSEAMRTSAKKLTILNCRACLLISKNRYLKFLVSYF